MLQPCIDGLQVQAVTEAAKMTTVSYELIIQDTAKKLKQATECKIAAELQLNNARYVHKTDLMRLQLNVSGATNANKGFYVYHAPGLQLFAQPM